VERDLRATPLYREIEEHFRRRFEPGFGRVTGATDPAPSPDGRWIAFTGSKLERLEGLPATRVCLADPVTGAVEETTNGPNDDRTPRWSPDGRCLAFLSDRETKGQARLYLIEAGRLGEARPTPGVDGTVEYHAWSPDGTAVLMGVAGSGADLAGVQGSGTAPGPQEDVPDWVPRVEGGEDDAWRRAWVFEDGAGASRPVSREGLNVWEATWCGPGQLAAVVSDEPGEGAWYDAPLALIDVASGKERILYRSEPPGERQLGLPAAPPSGRRLAVVEAICSDRLVVAGDLLLVDPETGDVTRVDTRGVDVTHLAWRDEDRLLLSGIRGLDTVVAEYDARSGSLSERWASAETCGALYPEAGPFGETGMAMILSSYARHPEIAVLDGDAPRTVASLADEGSRFLDSVAGAVEPVSWSAQDGLEIQGLLVRPEGPPPYALVTLVHGGPVGAYRSQRSGWVSLLASRGYAVLLPNPRGSSGRGQEFAAMVYGDMGGGDADDILAGIDAMVARGIADPGRLGVTGGSYGGFMSCWLITRTDRFAAAVAYSPVTDWFSQHHASNIGAWDRVILRDDVSTPGGEYHRRSPVMFAGRARTPTLLTAGTVDECTPPGQALEFYRALREHGVEAELALYPGEGHGVRKLPAQIDFGTRLVGWFERYMPPRAEA
jgi:dipeptidyl aminopeptidase/acylaminoacyl peptidase